MDFLTQNWMAIVVSSVIVFFASFLTHMVIPIHKGDFTKLPNEEEFLEANQSVPPGLYMFPFCEDHKLLNTPEFKAKMAKGPIGTISVFPGEINMGRNLGLTFAFYVLVGIFVAYVGAHSLSQTATYMDKFRLCGTVAFASHGLGWMSMLIWYRSGKFLPNFIDSVIYALLTGGVFGWLWK